MFDSEVLMNNIPQNQNYIYFCLGTPEFLADSFGSIAGTYLELEGIKNIEGNLDNPVTKLNVLEKLQQHRDKFIIVIDAGMTSSRNKFKTIEVLGSNTEVGLGDTYRVGNISIVYNCVLYDKKDTNNEIAKRIMTKEPGFTLTELYEAVEIVTSEIVSFEKHKQNLQGVG